LGVQVWEPNEDGIQKPLTSFPLNRCQVLAAHVMGHAVAAAHFFDDTWRTFSSADKLSAR
jgi:hypothetical protein